jgi:response regulator RpfG family c-di-GMP phosphodiesterase
MEKSTHPVLEFPSSALGKRSEVPAKNPAPTMGSHPAGNVSAQGKGYRDPAERTILLVSNDDYLRQMVRAYLEHLGFGVISCTDAQRAQEIASSTREIHLLLFDFSSSIEEALQIALELTEIRAGIPAVMISGARLGEDEIKRVENHAWKLLRKPVRLPELLAVIQYAFDGNTLQRNSRSDAENRSASKLPSIPKESAQLPASRLSPPARSKLELVWRKGEGDMSRW